MWWPQARESEAELAVHQRAVLVVEVIAERLHERGECVLVEALHLIICANEGRQTVRALGDACRAPALRRAESRAEPLRVGKSSRSR
jgi:hypothetical protein